MGDIKGNIFKITNSITKTSSELFKTTKLSFNLSTEEERLKAIYLDIGKKVHEIYQYGGSLGKAFDEKYAEIVKQEEKIQKLRQQIEIIKGTKTCPKCSGVMDKNAEFCSKCGYKAGAAEFDATPPEAARLVDNMDAEDINKDNVSSFKSYASPLSESASISEGTLIPASESTPVPISEITTNPISFSDSGTPEASQVKLCRACGKENTCEDKFCLYCGRML